MCGMCCCGPLSVASIAVEVNSLEISMLEDDRSNRHDPVPTPTQQCPAHLIRLGLVGLPGIGTVTVLNESMRRVSPLRLTRIRGHFFCSTKRRETPRWCLICLFRASFAVPDEEN